MSELLTLYRNAQRPYEKFIRYCATAPVGILPYYDGLLDQYSEAEQIFVKRVLELEAKYSALTTRIADLEARAEKAEAMVEKLNSWVEKLMDVGWGMWRESNFGGHETLNEIRWEQLANIISKERER